MTATYLCNVKYILYAILIYLLLRFIVGFIIPVWIASRKMKRGFKEMSARMEEHMRQQQEFASKPHPTDKRPGVNDDEYIEYEEVK